ncbi:hypothetical protein R5W24_006540 [Gemmata sp. JC717]|uniref:hypothetical protein n=1 Tax=Gemmata algarum TaxID=2975278 RepID=UPI0021BA412C|nr:hypothetical protein [Gemmata algarum]MDY3557351.1 hypothetical protein [Gemmata algarum]
MDTDRRDSLRRTVLESLGPEEYDRLVVSVPHARRAGRLRYWQEQSLARVPGGPVRLEDFVAAFEGAPLQQPPAPAPAQAEGETNQADWKKNAPVWVQEDRQLNEAEWLAAPHLIWMVAYLLDEQRDRPGEDRRHILFGCACCRDVWDLIQWDAARRLVELAEDYADGRISEAEFKAGTASALFADLEPHYRGLGGPQQLSARVLHAIRAARGLASDNYRMSHGAYCVAQETSTDAQYEFIPTPQRPMSPKGGFVPPDHEQIQQKVPLLFDIFGNPFRPVALDPAWRTENALALARQMYASREFSAMPVLADALQDAGCDSADILDHCRGPGPHVRGCWVVDLVLGKK